MSASVFDLRGRGAGRLRDSGVICGSIVTGATMKNCSARNRAMSKDGNFFAIGRQEFAQACVIGLNAAVAHIVLACGTGRDNMRTKWSCEAVSRHAGMSWRRARDAIAALESAVILKIDKPAVKRGRPAYTVGISLTENGAIWLPSELVVGANDEWSPLAKLRQAGDVNALQLLIELYGEQELMGDGGIPRSILTARYSRTRICECGAFDVYGFTPGESIAHNAGPLMRFGEVSPTKSTAWDHIGLLTDMGLLELVPHLAESDAPDAELVHALSGDDHAEVVAASARSMAYALSSAFQHEVDGYDFVLAVPKHMKKANVVGVYRLRYRPRTKRTAAWFAHHVENCDKAAAQYNDIAASNFQSLSASDIKVVQGVSKYLKEGQNESLVSGS